MRVSSQKKFLLHRDHRAPTFFSCGRLSVSNRTFLGFLRYFFSRSQPPRRHVRCLTSSRDDNRDGVRFTRSFRFSRARSFSPRHLISLTDAFIRHRIAMPDALSFKIWKQCVESHVTFRYYFIIKVE